MTTKNYWDNQTEQSLIKFNRARSQAKRDKIFEDHLVKPLRQMVEVYVARYLPASDWEYYSNDCLSYLMTVIAKYKPTKGKSFAYISIVVRNYVWKVSRNLADKNNKFVSGDIILYENDECLFDVIPDNVEEKLYLEPDKFKQIAEILLNYWTKERIRELLLVKYHFNMESSLNSAATIRLVLERHFLPNNPKKRKNAHMPTYRTMRIIECLVNDSKQLLEKNGIDCCN
jgi:hypothetical protein